MRYPDIDDYTYEDLRLKQEKNEATQDEKEKVTKHTYKKLYGIDKLGADLPSDKILNVERHHINNFTALIDANNIKYSKDNQTKEQHKKIETIKKLLSDLTFENVFDEKKIIKPDFDKLVDKITKENPLFTDKKLKVLFNMHKEEALKNNKQFLGYTNAILENYCIKLTYERVRVKGQKDKIGAYKLEQLNNINEILEYKIRKGYHLWDEKKIRKTSTTDIYKDLVDWTIKPKNTNHFIDEGDEEENPLDYGTE
jgi:hypothetical protein